MRILLIGKNGQLGRECFEVLSTRYDLLAVGSREMDITDPVQVEETVRTYQPDMIVNCAAFAKVDAAEQQRELACRVNIEGPRHLAKSLARHGGILLHLSTDYVFAGNKTIPEAYLEEDEVGPLSYYGHTKLEGESVIRRELDRYLIVRTAWMYGLHGHNFPKTMLRMAIRNPNSEIRVVNDQFGSPTWSLRLAWQLERLIATDGQGIYHATAEGYCTWYEVADYFLTRMGIPHKVIPCSTADYPTPALRPKNSILENQRLKSTGINLMRSWKEDLDEFVHSYREILIDEAVQR